MPAKADVAKAVQAAVASGEQGIVVVVNDEAITAYEIEQRARFLGLSANIGEQAKENFQRLVKSESTEEAAAASCSRRWSAPTPASRARS